MKALVLGTIAALLVGTVLVASSGCRAASDSKQAGKGSRSIDASAPSSEAASATTGTTPPSGSAPAASEPSPAPNPAPKTPAPTPSVQLGPINASVSWAYLKDMYQKNGVWYVVVDYIQVVGPEESIHFKNENPLLRTFPLSSKAKLLLLTGSGGPDYKSVSVAKFKAFEGKSGDEVVEVTPKGGYAIQLKEWWAP